ncbi:MAG: response regulator [Nitrospirae bacterium]|nr:response regulator [Nitrospirota bacterium]
MQSYPVQILLVEDDQGDVDLMMEGLNKAKILINMNVVDDGVKAMKYLRHEAPYTDSAVPDLLLLDLNLPLKDGREVLAEIKSDENLKTIPIVVLTTSDSEKDILKSYSLGANCYLTKPVNFSRFVEMVQGIQHFWLTLVKLPPR